MRKKILGLALIAMSLVAFNGYAQSSETSVKQEQVKTKKGIRKSSRSQMNPFEGLNLTEEQQSQLKQLANKRKAERKERATARKEQKRLNDSLRIDERRASKKAYLEEVKAILGTDKYIAFLENMYINSGTKAGGKTSFKKGKGFRHHSMHNGRRNKNAKRDMPSITGRAGKSSAAPKIAGNS